MCANADVVSFVCKNIRELDIIWNFICSMETNGIQRSINFAQTLLLHWMHAKWMCIIQQFSSLCSNNPTIALCVNLKLPAFLINIFYIFALKIKIVTLG